MMRLILFKNLFIFIVILTFLSVPPAFSNDNDTTFNTLGIKPGASKSEINSAFVKLMRKATTLEQQKQIAEARFTALQFSNQEERSSQLSNTNQYIWEEEPNDDISELSGELLSDLLRESQHPPAHVFPRLFPGIFHNDFRPSIEEHKKKAISALAKHPELAIRSFLITEDEVRIDNNYKEGLHLISLYQSEYPEALGLFLRFSTLGRPHLLINFENEILKLMVSHSLPNHKLEKLLYLIMRLNLPPGPVHEALIPFLDAEENLASLAHASLYYIAQKEGLGKDLQQALLQVNNRSFAYRTILNDKVPFLNHDTLNSINEYMLSLTDPGFTHLASEYFLKNGINREVSISALKKLVSSDEKILEIHKIKAALMLIENQTEVEFSTNYIIVQMSSGMPDKIYTIAKWITKSKNVPSEIKKAIVDVEKKYGKNWGAQEYGDVIFLVNQITQNLCVKSLLNDKKDFLNDTSWSE